MSCGNNCAGCGCGDQMDANTATPDEINAYFNGLGEGVRAFAWWKDGTQYVGTTGRTLKQALEQVEIDRSKALLK